ncbi:uncharacterized protein AKAME5_002704900 [Lates japonicus]|uniref:Uncharacterized protein n=1 Tax=Lates japonicus TaxID=270547 RepID=A0AAD3M2Y2_LATJO|nr:uncharacterized protein AKAME5_002704900 [Lates japonicus]
MAQVHHSFIVFIYRLLIRCPEAANKIPETAATTTARPEMMLISDVPTQIVHLELTVPWENCTEEADDGKVR